MAAVGTTLWNALKGFVWHRHTVYSAFGAVLSIPVLMKQRRFNLPTVVEIFVVARCGTTVLAFIGRRVQQTVPFSGRKHTILLPRIIEIALGQLTFDKFEKDASKKGIVASLQSGDYRLTKRIADSIIAVLQEARGGGYQKHIGLFKWELLLVKDPVANACVFPGGKIVVYTGLLDLLDRNPDMLAMVLAHETAHALARHSSERMSLSLVAILLLKSLVSWLAGGGGQGSGQQAGQQAQQQEDQQLQDLNSLFQILVGLPFSRRHEFEADLIGLHLMKAAGYNPDKAPETFRRLEASESSVQSNNGQTEAAAASAELPLERLGCTHPRSSHRAVLLEKELEALRVGGDKALDRVVTKLDYWNL